VQDAIKKMQSQLPWPESYDYGNGQGNCTPLVGSISAWAVWISGWLTAHTAAHPQQPKMEGILEEEVRLGAQSRDWNPPRITCAVDRGPGSKLLAGIYSQGFCNWSLDRQAQFLGH